jgi:hypothetical protein
MASEPSTSSHSEDRTASAFDPPLPEYVDWIVAAVIAFGGLTLTVGGSALAFVVDRDLLEAGIESGEITVIVVERELTEAQMLDFTLGIVDWTGIGLLVTGVGLVLFALGYVFVRHRAYRQAAEGEPVGSTRSYAVLGAVATAILSFIPFSPLVGGGVAGYLAQSDTGRSVSAGGLSGFLAMLPALSILGFLIVGMYTGLAGVGEAGLGIVAAAAMLIVVLFVVAYGAGLGALGGFLGGRFAENDS